MKKTLVALLLAVMSLTASAQFERGTKYVNLSLSGFDMFYNYNTKFCIGIEGVGGYFVEDRWMLKGVLGYTYLLDANDFHMGAGFRHYFQSNGIFLGAGMQYEYVTSSKHYFQLTPEVGYCFYINRFVSIEPSVYYNMCLNDFRKGSTVGLKLSVGLYL